MALTERRVAFNQQVCSVTPRRDVDPLFLHAMMVVAKPLVQSFATGAIKHMVTKSRLEEVVLYEPPKQKRDDFDRLVQDHSQMQVVHREALRQTEHLFQSLLYRYFGESN